MGDLFQLQYEFDKDMGLKLLHGADDAMLEIGERILDEAQQNLEDYDLIDQGILVNSGQVNHPAPLDVSVIFLADHGVVVEHGAGPSGEFGGPGWWPPFEPIYKWCRRNGVRFMHRVQYGKTKTGKKRKGKAARRKKATKMTYKQTAYMIMRSIKKRGLKARPFFRPAIQLVQYMADAIFEKHMGEVESSVK